jgi:hypothetical protein
MALPLVFAFNSMGIDAMPLYSHSSLIIPCIVEEARRGLTSSGWSFLVSGIELPRHMHVARVYTYIAGRWCGLFQSGIENATIIC